MTLCFLKLGGSLITDKDSPNTARPAVLARLADEVASALQQKPDLQLVIGHGSGSYGHMAASRHKTHLGVRTPAEWRGFAEVWQAAHALNQLVIEAMSAVKLPVIAMPPSAGAIARRGQVVAWDLRPMSAALSAGLIPVVQGDVIFDEEQGGGILSTEEAFLFLARQLKPHRILLTGIEPGVWADYPTCTRLIHSIHPANIAEVACTLRGSSSVDVTGGMLSKVQTMLSLAVEQPGLEILIFSAREPGILESALGGASHGTRISSAASSA